MGNTMRIRYKHGGSVVGDMAAHNGYNVPGGFCGAKYPGYEEDIPSDLLDSKIKKINYKNPDGTREIITEKQHRYRLHLYGGYDKDPNWHDPAPPPIPGNSNGGKLVVPPRQLSDDERADLMLKQEIAVLYFKHFNPLCMELIGSIPAEIMVLARKEYPQLFLNEEDRERNKPEDNRKNVKAVDITKIDVTNAVKIIKDVKDMAVLKEWSIVEARVQPPRAQVLVTIEEQIKSLENQPPV